MTYFTAGTINIKTEPTDVNDVIEEVKQLLEFSIKEKDAVMFLIFWPYLEVLNLQNILIWSYKWVIEK